MQQALWHSVCKKIGTPCAPYPLPILHHMPNTLSKTVAGLVLSICLSAAPGVAQVASEATSAPRSADFIAKGKYMVGVAPTVGFGPRVGVIAGGRLYGGYFWHKRNLVGVALRNFTQI